MKRKRKETIPKCVIGSVWNTYNGMESEVKCFCCGTADITFRNWQCGHVVSEHHGGRTTVDNLRPVCGECNGGMGVQNMEEFMEKWGFKKNRHWNGYQEEPERPIRVSRRAKTVTNVDTRKEDFLQYFEERLIKDPAGRVRLFDLLTDLREWTRESFAKERALLRISHIKDVFIERGFQFQTNARRDDDVIGIRFANNNDIYPDWVPEPINQ